MSGLIRGLTSLFGAKELGMYPRRLGLE